MRHLARRGVRPVRQLETRPFGALERVRRALGGVVSGPAASLGDEAGSHGRLDSDDTDLLCRGTGGAGRGGVDLRGVVEIGLGL